VAPRATQGRAWRGGFGVTSRGTRTNLVLLGWTQEYLRSLLQQETPDALLTAAWDEFYRVYDGLMRRFAYSRGLSGSDVDDCLQAVWMEVAARFGDFEIPETQGGLRSWLYTLVRSKAGDLLRRRQRRPAESLDTAREVGHEPADREAQPPLVMEQQWERALLETLLEELRQEISETNWRLLQMRCLEGREVPEVAAELGLSSEQVWYRQRRLMKKLKTRVAVFTGQSFSGDEDDGDEDDGDDDEDASVT
jgi:RNA polymerase sigma factor (sigma-70 family)